MRQALLGLLVSVVVAAGVVSPTGAQEVSAAADRAAAAASGAAVAPPGQDAPPNILLITTDDQNVDDLRHMPFTRELIGGAGVTFTDAIAPYPLCCPARATLLTGMFNHNNGVLGNDPPHGGYDILRNGPYHDRTLPTWLKAAGYRTTFVGKFLNQYGVKDPYEIPPGWDRWAAGVKGVYNYYSGVVNEDGELVERGFVSDYSQRVVEESIQDAHDESRPFFIWQSELAPHGGCHPQPDGSRCWGPPAWAPEDDRTFVDLPLQSRSYPSFNERVVADKPRHIQETAAWRPRRIDRVTEANRARVRSLQSVDRNVRESVRLLERLGELDDTLVIFTSDNGYLMGQHRRTGKVLPYEHSLKVPFLMRGPGVPEGKQVRGTASLVDVAATVAEAAGVEPLIEQDGRSLLPVARGEEPGWGASPIEAGDDEAQGAFQWLYQGVRTRRYVYLEYPGTGERELYDRVRDPHQLTNVAYRPTHRATRRALAGKLAALRDCAGEVCRSDDGTGVPAPEPDRAPIHPDDLASVGDAYQVVTVTAPTWRSRKGTAVAWRRVGRRWQIVRGPFPVQLGSAGLSRPGVRRHLTGKTPAGAFRPASAMGFRTDPGTALRYRRLDRNDQWPYDPRHAATYNVFQPYRSATARWRPRLAEVWSERRKRYRYALVMRHNLPRKVVRALAFDERVARVPADVRQGSFVIHVGNRVGRQGWVSMRPAQLRWTLRWMRPRRLGTTFVVGPTRYLRRNL